MRPRSLFHPRANDNLRRIDYRTYLEIIAKKFANDGYEVYRRIVTGLETGLPFPASADFRSISGSNIDLIAIKEPRRGLAFKVWAVVFSTDTSPRYIEDYSHALCDFATEYDKIREKRFPGHLVIPAVASPRFGDELIEIVTGGEDMPTVITSLRYPVLIELESGRIFHYSKERLMGAYTFWQLNYIRPEGRRV